jgi:ribosomal-protein-alanine N-acetyltransferase
VTRATLEVRASNEPARQLYESLGFTVAATRPRYYTQPEEDALILLREGLADLCHPDLERATPES